MKELAGFAVGAYICVLVVFGTSLLLVLLADSVALSGGAFALALSAMVMSAIFAIVMFPVAYAAAKYRETHGD